MSETEEWAPYTCSYRMPDGSEWGFEITASSHADAQRRIDRIRGNATVEGRIVAKVRVPKFTWRFWNWLIGVRP